MRRTISYISLFSTIGLGIFLFSGVLWIGIILMIVSITYLLFSIKKFKQKRRLFSILRSFFVVVLIFLSGIAIRLFFIEIYAIPSPSMESTLIPGDKILVDKMAYGPKLPRSPFEIPWLNIFFYLNENARERMDEPWWDYKRLSGTSKIRQGDVLVFKKSENDKIPLIKRCIGTPGEIFEVKDGLISGHKNEEWLGNTLIPLGIDANERHVLLEWLDSIDIHYSPLYISGTKKNMLEVRLPVKFLEKLQSLACTDSVFLKKPPEQIRSYYLGAVDSAWDIYNFGPIEVPEKGKRITLDKQSYALYHDLIRNFENIDIKETGNKHFVNGREINTYTFKDDYYFMMGDNREDSQDSRYFGFVPERNIIGRADFILFSSGYGGFKWKRLLKIL